MPLPGAPSTGDDLTGEYRFRSGWLGCLVLEVKCRCRGDTLVQRNAFFWRDAKEGDLWRLRAIRRNFDRDLLTPSANDAEARHAD